MNRDRFVCAIARNGALAPGIARLVEHLALEFAGECIPAKSGVAMAASGLPPIVFAAQSGEGVILGNIFHKDRAGRVRQACPNAAAQIVLSNGACLLEQYWGDYIAFIRGPGRFDVVRAPFGERSLCWFQTADTLFIASDLRALARCGCDLRTIAWDNVARHLAEPDIRRNQTCLAEVGELRGGSRLSIVNGAISTMSLWSPWDRSTEGGWNPDPKALRAAIDRCVADKLDGYAHPLLLLSGGLDSSILAAATAFRGMRVSAFNLVTEDRSGDERTYARMAAAAFDIPCFEELRELGNVDPLRSAANWLPRPALRSFLQDSAILSERVAAREGCDVLIEGSGGDNVFCSLQSVAPVADRIRCGGTVGDVIASARDTALLTEATLATVLRRAIYRAWFRADAYRVLPDCTFLSREAVALAKGATVHPWLAPGRPALPGKMGHAALLVAAQGWAECLDPLAAVPTLGPLLAQPIVEACFAVPSWAWFRDGQNRVVARDAYRGTLPGALLDRRSKATPDCFVTQLFDRDRQRLIEFLLDGKLAGAGLLDRPALELVLRRDGPTRDHVHYRIMRIVDVEAWLRDRPVQAALTPAFHPVP